MHVPTVVRILSALIVFVPFCLCFVSQAIDRPINTRQYIIENLRLQGALETKEKEARNSRKDQETGQGDDSKMEKDTLQAEGEYDLNTLMFPDGMHLLP
jgi:hypothetical protein